MLLHDLKSFLNEDVNNKIFKKNLFLNQFILSFIFFKFLKIENLKTVRMWKEFTYQLIPICHLTFNDV